MPDYHLPLKAPNPLPASGVDIVTFKVWKNTLIAHVQQDANHYQFMEAGRYSTWQARESGRYIPTLAVDDPEKRALDEKKTNLTLSSANYDTAIEELTSKRNAQLAKFITHVATLVHYTEHDDVTMQSTSLEWIFSYLRKHYGLETKGANFLNITNHTFKKGMPEQTFYKQYRSSFLDNLRKAGDVVIYKNNKVLHEDEQLSPSFENAIVLWSLEKIDPRLPAKVKKNYGHQMTGNTTLRDIQPVIFENIPAMLEELDTAENTKAFAAKVTSDDLSLNALQNRGGNNRGRRGSRGTWRGDRRPGQGSTSRFPVKNKSDKFCRMCFLAGTDPKVHTSHEIGKCSRLTIADLESLKNALLLNGMITEAAVEEDYPDYFLQPGWDDAEAEQLQVEAVDQD